MYRPNDRAWKYRRPTLQMVPDAGLGYLHCQWNTRQVEICIPLDRLDRSISITISTVCSICTKHSPSEQTGRTSTDILCHDASNSLCPSNKVEIPAFPLHGSNFRKGVRFSVQTTSPGSVPCKRCSWLDGSWSPAGSKEATGRVVRVESMKFNDAQKRPDRDWVRAIHFVNALKKSADVYLYHTNAPRSTYRSSFTASIHAHNSTPVPPSFAPFHGLEPQLSASHRPVVNRRCSSLV